METDHVWMGHVLSLCEGALLRGDCPVAAVVVRDGAIIGSGSNTVATGGDPTAHAEIAALRDAAARSGTPRLDGCTLVSAMEPCPMCCWALREAGITRLVLGARHAGMRRTDYGDYSVERLLELTRSTMEIVVGVREAECESMRRRWSRWVEPSAP